MKRYSMDYYIAEDADGEWVQYEEAQAEIARLQVELFQAVDVSIATANRLHALIRVLRADAPNT